MATKILTIGNQDLLNKADFSALKSPVAAGDTTIPVYSISKFAINYIILIGELGQEGSEIIATSASVAPTGNDVALASGLLKPHQADTKIYIIPFNKVEITTSSTVDGSKSGVSGSPFVVDPEKTDTTYTGTASSGYYFIRWYNSVTNSYGDYSDPIPYSGFSSKTVSYIIDLALSETNRKISDKLTYQMLIAEVNACLRYVRGKLKKWSNVEEFDYIVDQMDRGEYKFLMPDTYYDKNSNRSCLGVRVGDRTLDYIDKLELDQRMEDTHLTTVASQAAPADTQLELTSAADFEDSGNVHVYSGTTQYDISYTSKSGNILLGVPASGTGSITDTLTTGLNVWQGEAEGSPREFTIADGYLYLWPLINSADSGMNIKMNFYTEIIEVNSDSDEITLARHDMVKYWLKWAIRNIVDRNGKMDFQDGDWIMFNGILTDAIRRETTGQKYKSAPRINGIFYRGQNSPRNATFDNT